MTSSNEQEKIGDLEVQVAHQTKILDELNETVRAQWTEIDKLTRSVTLLAERLLNIEASNKKGTPGDEPPPPHY
ncbi:SlyX family protein [Parvibaculaceae bacterium PLY_AMNH_Bact1]|nr:SlyX family protein [Parvibaculaceae bacterium PLY_AMNH_Bact1]